MSKSGVQWIALPQMKAVCEAVPLGSSDPAGVPADNSCASGLGQPVTVRALQSATTPVWGFLQNRAASWLRQAITVQCSFSFSSWQHSCLLQKDNIMSLAAGLQDTTLCVYWSACLRFVVELFDACLLQASFGSMASQMREHLKEEDDTRLALLRQHLSRREAAPVSSQSWHLLDTFPC